MPGERSNESLAVAPTHALVLPLGAAALGATLASCGIAKLFVASDASLSASAIKFVITGLGILTLILGGSSALRCVRRLPPAEDDCRRYGRHMTGLTFVLLVIGLCNAVGTSTLACEGGLDFTASAIIDAADPERTKTADGKLDVAKSELKDTKRGVELAARVKQRAEARRAKACALANTITVSTAEPAAGATPQLNACEKADQAVEASADDFGAKKAAYLEAQENVNAAERNCASARAAAKRALFFLLSLATMMSLFGASFYVVNSVRSKRPRLLVWSAAGSPSGSSVAYWEFGPSSDGFARPVARDASSVRGGVDSHAEAAASSTASAPRATEEPFDVHAFWSGAFFRVGEAVLFTFAFFWLMWSSDRRAYVVWLPVLGLFVGMFVKTGEAIIFRLGMQVLSAVAALLPAGGPPPAGATRQPREQAPLPERKPKEDPSRVPSPESV